MGDLGQLPPICRHGARKRRGARSSQLAGLCPHCHLLRSPAFIRAQHLHLTKVYRQAEDVEFAEFLNEVRAQPPTPQRLRAILGACGVPDVGLGNVLDATATVLCTHNRDVRRHNRTALQWHQHHGDVRGQTLYEVAMRHDAHTAPPPTPGTSNDSLAAWIKLPNFHHPTRVAVGARVIFTQTVNKAGGTTHSAVGTVTAVHLAPWPDAHPGDRA